MKFDRISLILFSFATVFLILNTVALSRDYQDSWVLEGLVIPFALFVTTFAVAFFTQKKMSFLVVLAVITRFVFLLIPNLKYVWFLGTAVDQERQFALANHVVASGHIYNGEFGGEVYGATPLIHILFSIFSMIPGVPVLDSIKYVPVLLSTLYPLITYIIIKSLKVPRETTLLKFGLLFSSIPFNVGSYLVTGGQFGALIALLAFLNLVLLLQKKDRRYGLIFIILVLALSLYHTVSSTFFTIFLFGTIILQRIPSLRLANFIRTRAVIAAALIGVAVLMFQATDAFTSMLQTVFIASPGSYTPGSEFIPSSFFSLALADPIGGIMVTLVYYGMDVFLLLLALGGLIVLLKERKELSNLFKFLLLLGGLPLLFIPIGAIMKVGTFRLVYFVIPFLLLFSSVFLLYLGSKKKWLPIAVFSFMMILAPIELYACQPLIPSANIVYKELPKTEPIGYVGQVTSVYQRQMILFAQNYVTGKIAGDAMSTSQVLGSAGYKYTNEHVIYYNPLDTSQPPQKYDALFIHLAGKSGILPDNAKARSPSSILNAIYSSNVVYTNGESYILKILES